MNITIEKRDLARVLTIALKAIPQKPLNPINECFLMECGGGVLKVTATDGNMQISATTPCEGEGKAVVSAKKVLDYIKLLPDTMVQVDTNEREMKISFGKGHSSIPLDNLADWQMLDTECEMEEVNLPMFRSAIAHTIIGCTDDELRPILTGIYVDTTKDITTMVATDGHKIIACPTAKMSCGAFIIPKCLASVIKDLEGETASIGTNGGRVVISTEGIEVSAKQIEGRYPNWSSVIPQSHATKVTYDKGMLLSALRRTSVFSSKSARQVKMTIEMLGTTIQCQDIDFSVSSQEQIQQNTIDGAGLEIGFNVDYLSQLIASLSCEEVEMYFTDAMHGMKMCGDGETIVLMPVTIQ